jgi:adenylate cyclase
VAAVWPKGALSLRPSVAATLVLGFGALVVIAVGAVLLITLGTAEVNTRELLRASARQHVDAVVASVSVTLAPARAQAEFLARLIGSGEIDPRDDDRLRTVLLGALAAAPQASGVAFIRTDLSTVRATRTLSSFDSRTSPARDRTDARKVLAEAERSAGPKWGEILYVPELGDTQITLYAPVRRGSHFLGAVVSVVSIANLSRSLSESSNSNSVAFILTEDDRVIAHPALAGGPRGVSSEKPLLKLTEIADPVLEHIWSMPERAAFPTSSDGSVLAHAVDVSGEEYTFLYRRVDDYGEAAWIVGAYVKSSLALPLMDRIRWAALATGGILIAAVVLSMLLSRAILRPVRELAEGAAAVSRFEFDAVPPLKGAAFREVDAAMSAFNSMIRGLRLFATYVPRSLVHRLLGMQSGAGLRPEEREITVLFTDIVAFTELSRRLTPLRLAAFLNRHFEILGRAIDAEGGTIDKYIGDSVMAFWGAPDYQPDHALRACRAALAMAEAVQADNARRSAKGRAPIRLRIGLHTGPAIVGNIGAPSRINYTLVGDTVNVAQRLEQLGKSYSAEKDVTIVASEATLARAGMLAQGQALGAQGLKGRPGAMEVYALVQPTTA